MQLEHISSEKFKQQILPIMQKHLDLNKYRVFVFGSRVTGKSSERSDIDIGIDGATAVSAAIMESIKEDIDNLPVLYKMDVVDFQKVSTEFRQVALQHIEQL